MLMSVLSVSKAASDMSRLQALHQMLKGVNKDANSLKQAQRLEFHDLRDVHTHIEIIKRGKQRDWKMRKKQR